MAKVNRTTYHPISGRLECCFYDVDEDEFWINNPDNYPYLDYNVRDHHLHYVDVATKQLKDVPPAPSPYHRFDWNTKGWVIESFAPDMIRTDRNDLLSESDWSQAADVPAEVREAYLEYRQALRDVPQQPGFPENIIWPNKPT